MRQFVLFVRLLFLHKYDSNSPTPSLPLRLPIWWVELILCNFMFCCQITLTQSWSNSNCLSYFSQWISAMAHVQRWALTQRQWRAKVSNWAASLARGGVKWRVAPLLNGTSGQKERLTLYKWVHTYHCCSIFSVNYNRSQSQLPIPKDTTYLCMNSKHWSLPLRSLSQAHKLSVTW